MNQPKTDSALTREQKLAKIKAQEKSQQRKQRGVVVGAVVAVVVVLVVIGGILLQASRVNNTSGGDEVPPAGYSEDAQLEITESSVIVGNRDASRTLSIFEDPICPYCGQFEESTASTIAEAIATGDVKVEYTNVAFLDAASTDGRYSSRAANLLASVAVHEPGKWVEVHGALYSNQPEEGSSLSNDELLDIAKEAGVENTSVTEDVNSFAYGNWVLEVTDATSRSGIQGTPTVLLDGETLEDRTNEGLRAALGL